MPIKLVTLLSRIIKFGLIFASFFLVPSLAHAKTIVFNDQKWETNINFTSFVSQPFVRNDFSLMDLAQANFSGQGLAESVHLLDDQAILDIQKITDEVNQPPQDAHVVITGNQAENFNPGQNGQSVDFLALIDQLNSEATQIQLPVILSEPKVKLAGSNQLGINELVAVGESNFAGSPSNRIHNITVGAAKYDGLIIAPGEEFSFNTFLGDVDAQHGFLPELVIKATGVTPEFGGGLCQVSTTAFRAAMNAGLPITARRNHSFAVSYYAPQGTDATIYPGVSDMKFINNLSSSLLIHTKIIGRKLYFEYYGTKDDRAVTFDGPTVFDRKANGAMKAVWTRHVTMNDQTTIQTFNSNYLPPALFHHEDVASTPNPQAAPTPPPTGPAPVPLTQ